jgi:hypothetical protein
VTGFRGPWIVATYATDSYAPGPLVQRRVRSAVPIKRARHGAPNPKFLTAGKRLGSRTHRHNRPRSHCAPFAGRGLSFSRSARPPARVLCRGLASTGDDGLDEFHFIWGSLGPAIVSGLAIPCIHDVAAVAAHGGVIVALALRAYLHVIRRPTVRAVEVAWRRSAWRHRLRSKLVEHLRGHDVRVLSQLGHARVHIRTCGR